MTEISIKIGRFMCDSTVNGKQICSKSMQRVNGCNNDVISAFPTSRTHSASNFLQQPSNGASRKLSLPDFQNWDFYSSFRDAETAGKGEKTTSGDELDGINLLHWPDDYNRTICPHENDRILNLFRIVHLQDTKSDDCESQHDLSAEPEVECHAALPWRSEEQMAVLEDTSKYLRQLSDLSEDAPTPQIGKLGMVAPGPRVGIDDDDYVDDVHPLASFHHSSSSSSLRNLASLNVPRPDLSNCHSLSLSHWLSEAESRHSEPYCAQHHHVLNTSSAAFEDHSILSSTGRRRNSRQPVDRSHQQHPNSSSSSSTSSRASSPLQIPDDEECRSITRYDQVLQWLMTNDLTEPEGEETDQLTTDDR